MSSGLEQMLRELGSALVAYSGGTDSTYLLAICLDVLGRDNVLAVTVRTPFLPSGEADEARAVAEQLGAPFLLVDAGEVDDPELLANTPDRCYYCKRLDLQLLKRIAVERGLAEVLLGANVSDLSDHRPGARAAAEMGARSPLQEAGLTKDAIRERSRRRGLPTWDKPSNACLASRIPYGTPITIEALRRVDSAEAWLRQRFGVRQLRVRDHGPVARIEVDPHQIASLTEASSRDEIVGELRRIGYQYVTLDLQGFRSGSMNEVLPR